MFVSAGTNFPAACTDVCLCIATGVDKIEVMASRYTTASPSAAGQAGGTEQSERTREPRGSHAPHTRAPE